MATRHKMPTHRNKTSRAKSAANIQLNRRFENNPFKKQSSRTKLVSIKHEAILKQFSSTHLAAPYNEDDIPPKTRKMLASIGKFDEANPANESPEIVTYGDSSSSSNSQANEEPNGMMNGVDDAPLIFEFPYYLNTISRNMHFIKQRFMQQQKVEALKLAIQTARLLIYDLVLSEPQFYPAIYVLVSKLLDKFGALVYDWLYSLAVFGGDTTINEQCAHNFIPQTAAAATATPVTDSERISEYVEFKPTVNKEKKNVYDREDMKVENTESLPPNFRASHCSMLCQIKCGNWFFKISAIRELVPRILVEISLYRTLRFLYPLRELLSYTKMLIKRLRGISNPLVAAYVTIFALEQIFVTFGTNSFVYDDDLINEKQSHHAAPIRMDNKKKNGAQKAWDFDMIEDIYLSAFNNVLFLFKSMYDTNFMFVECVFYGQMASEDYLNLFNPIFSMIFEILKYNKVLQNVNDIKMYLKQKINPDLLKLIDCDAFLGIKKSRNRNGNEPHYAFKLDPSKNVYNKNRNAHNKQMRADDKNPNVLNEIALNFDETEANTQYVD